MDVYIFDFRGPFVVKKLSQYKLYGSMTVEAAYVGTLIIFMIITILYISIYMYDRVSAANCSAYLGNLVTQSAFKWIDTANKEFDKNEEYSHTIDDSYSDAINSKITKIETRGEHYINENLLIARVEMLDIDYSYNMVFHKLSCTVTVQGSLPLPISLFGYKSLNFKEHSTTTKIDTIKALWLRDSLMKG